MQFSVIFRSIGLLTSIFSLTMLPPIVVAWIYDEATVHIFWKGFLIVLVSGLVLWFPFRHAHKDLRQRDGFLIVFLFWITLGSTGAAPFLLAEDPEMTVTDALFESFSGFTTTGATVLSGLDDLPRSLLYYRQQLQWFGGMGIIVLAVAVLPVLGIGGMQLYRAEAPGPVKDVKLTPRITETAKALWAIYLGITVACAISYRLAGMGWFDAVGHAFSTVANGGYSTHDASIGFFNSLAVESVGVFFMVLSGVNFSLHFTALQRRSLRGYFFDSEMRGYFLFLVLGASVVCGHLVLMADGQYSVVDALHHGIFQVVSFMTTSGFTTTEFFHWPALTPVVLVFIGFVGGCAGSTAGGIKVIRVILLCKQGEREIKRLIHPNAWVPVKVGGTPQGYRIVDAVWGFFALYVVSFVLLMLLTMEAGLDQVSAFSAVAACINNVGPGLGEVAMSFATVSDPVKWLGCFAMVLGRLEIFTVLVLLTPSYWRS